MTDWAAIEVAIVAATGTPLRVRGRRAVSGGCINRAYVLEWEPSYFVKLNRVAASEMFAAEAAGLAELAAAHAIGVPLPITHGVVGGEAYLVLSYIDFGSPGAGGAERLGQALAALHRHQASRHGFVCDNTIGATPQHTVWDDDWVRFYTRRRLGFQLELAARQGYAGDLQRHGVRLLSGIKHFFADYRPVPSLLHGDLWSGNYGYDQQGVPVIFDPAPYYGDRETDLAMTELFGGFEADFYRAYREAWPLDAGYPERKILYQFYHVLNHLNLFGGGYHAQAVDMAARLCAHLGSHA